MMNDVKLLGRLAQDPELKKTPSGRSVTSFDLAVPVRSNDRNAQPDYIPVVCWEAKAEFVCRHLSKGRQIIIEGKLKTRKFMDTDGRNRKVMEVVCKEIYFADSKTNGGNGNADTTPSDLYEDDGFAGLSDEDLPF